MEKNKILENKLKENEEKNQNIEKNIKINSEKLDKIIKQLNEKTVELQDTTSGLLDNQTYIENAKKEKTKIG